MAAPNHALVVGALGIVGSSLIDHLDRLPGWTVTGISRTPPKEVRWRHLPLDLTDAEACRKAGPAVADVTHVYYCARFGSQDPDEEFRVNTSMLANIVVALKDAAPGLAHICLVHGTKWYGSHLGPYRTPARETDPRHAGPNFYYSQLDALVEMQRGCSWRWSTVRPHIVCSPSVGYPFNLVTLLGVYGSICAARGLPLDFPGTETCFRSLSQATDAALLARAMVWASTTPACADESFNIINGDYFRWSGLWPRLAAFFGVPMGSVRTMPLSRAMADSEPVWTDLAARHGLERRPISQIANWGFGDFLFRADWDDVSSTVKSRRYGFHDAVDTEASILEALASLREARIIP